MKASLSRAIRHNLGSDSSRGASQYQTSKPKLNSSTITHFKFIKLRKFCLPPLADFMHRQILFINQLQKGIIKYHNLPNIQSTTMTKANTSFPNSTPPLTPSIENHVVLSQYE